MLLIFRKTATLSLGECRASSGQQDVGHEGVATRGGVPSLRSYIRFCGVSTVSLSQRSLRCFAPYRLPVKNNKEI